MARHYGIANMLISHKLTDLDNVGDQGSAMRALASSLLANAETRIVYRQEPINSARRRPRSDSPAPSSRSFLHSAPGRGCGGSKIAHSFCQHQMHPAELALFDTTARMAGAG